MTVLTRLLDDYERHLRDLDRAEATLDAYLPTLRRMDKDLPAGLLCATTEELQAWIYGDGQRSKATRSLYRAAACSFFGWAVDPNDPRLDFNSAELLPTVSVPARPARAIADDLLRDILARAARPHRDWFLIAAYAGLRCIEIAGLDREHITEEEVFVHGKGDKYRVVPTHPLIWAAAQELPAGPVATEVDGRRLTRRQVSQRGNRYLICTLQHKATMHDLRRWFGTRTYEASGGDIRAVQELLGHAQVNTTQRYIATSAQRKAGAVAGLPLAA